MPILRFITMDWLLISNVKGCKPKRLSPNEYRRPIDNFLVPVGKVKRASLRLTVPPFRPPEQLLEAGSAQDAEKFLGHVLQRMLLPEANVPLGADMPGFLGFARAPAMIREECSSIVSPRGNTVTYIRPDCISTWVAIPSPRASSSDALRFVFERLHGVMHLN